MSAPRVDVRFVAAPAGPRLRERAVRFELVDARLLGEEAQRAGGWRYYCTHGGSVARNYRYRAETETVVAIAAPTGATAVWFGRANALAVTLRSAARAAVESSAIAEIWNETANKGGPKTSGPFARAAGRLLHAEVFEYVPDERDRLLAEYLGAPSRPNTELILAAPLDALAAASALRQVGQTRQANALIRRATRELTP